MFGMLGLPEIVLLGVITPLAVITYAIPVATLVFVIKIHRRLQRLEQRLPPEKKPEA